MPDSPAWNQEKCGPTVYTHYWLATLDNTLDVPENKKVIKEIDNAEYKQYNPPDGLSPLTFELYATSDADTGKY